jgi:hypothetical protein
MVGDVVYVKDPDTQYYKGDGLCHRTGWHNLRTTRPAKQSRVIQALQRRNEYAKTAPQCLGGKSTLSTTDVRSRLDTGYYNATRWSV